MSQKLAVLLCSWLILGCLASSQVQADGWIWNPFAKSSSSMRDSSPLYSNTSTSKSKSKSWLPTLKAPKMPWPSSTPKTSSYSRNNTSTWGKMTKSTKRWWNKTTDLLDPYPEPKPATSSYVETKKPKTNWFTGWFSNKESEPKTVNDFLRQETPQ